MVFEKTARKREEAAASAALQATKPAFVKVEKGLEYLRSHMNQYQSQLDDWKERADVRQGTTEAQMDIVMEDGRKTRRDLASEGLERQRGDAENASRIGQVEHTQLSQCHYCGAILSPLQIVCHECGTIHSSFPYDVRQLADQEVIQNAVMKELLALSETIRGQKEISEEYTYREEMADEIFTMETLLSIVQKYEETHENASPLYRNMEKRIRDFLRACKRNRIELAVIGNVKAGKSSLINALLGGKMASVDATPETSVLVKYRTTHQKNYIRATFYTEQQWKSLWDTVEANSVFQRSYAESGAERIKESFLGHKPYYETCSEEQLSSLIMKWTSSQFPEHFFVRELEVGYQGDAFPHDVVLVDTPGLRDPVKYRSNITRKYISKSDWVLACIANENLSSQEEFDFLARILSCNGQRPDRVVVVATKADMLNSNDCKKKQQLFLQQAMPLYGSEGATVEHFASTSAELHSLLTEYLAGRIAPDSGDLKRLRKMLTELDIYDLAEIAGRTDEIFKFAGVERLFEKVDKLVLRGRRKALLSDLRQKYRETVSYVLQKMASTLGTAEEDLYGQISGLLDVQHQRETLNGELADVQSLIDVIKSATTRLREAMGQSVTGKKTEV